MTHAAIDRWFASRGWEPFAFQRELWTCFRDGGSGLLHAPTGTGKTYAAWFGPLAGALSGDWSAPGLRVLWLTPLRALANDLVEALRGPVTDLDLGWRVELRTGDTSSSVKRRQLRRPPEALVTTPESLSVLLSTPDAPRLLASVGCAVVDEWHELLGSKRGVQAELGLAALRRFAPGVRTWGLSASLENLEEAMHVLLGPRAAGRVIAAPLRKRLEVETLLPDTIDRFPWSGHIGTRLLGEVIERIHGARTTLLFTNTRAQAEIWFQALLRADDALLGHVAIHHGSLDRDVRHEVERRLRGGALKAVVCTSSLDLGIDFPPVDQIVQIGSPKGLARLMQRAGRSGHQPNAVSRVVGVPTMALEVMEFAAAREELARGNIEPRTPLECPLDVLVQHVVTRSMGGGFVPDDLLAEVRTTHAYRDLPDDTWRWVLEFVEHGGATLGAYPEYRRIARRNGRYVVGSPRIGRRHRLSIGTITSDSAMVVRLVGGRTLGTIEESFIARLRPGDRFVYAGRLLELARIRDMTAYARRAVGGSGQVPRWMGGRSPLSTHLAAAVRRRLDDARRDCFEGEEMSRVRDLLQLQARWSVIPALDELLIERSAYRGSHHVFVFPLAGRLVHEGLSSLVAHRITRRRPCTIGLTSNDYGFELVTREPLEFDADAWRTLLAPDDLVADLRACLNATELQRRHFREIARVAGLIDGGYPGEARPTRHLQASSDLFFDVFSEFDPTNLLLEQARREVLERELEVQRLRATLDRIRGQRIVLRPTRRFSPLAFPLWAEHLRARLASSERWAERVRKMVLTLERAAGRRAAEVTA